MTTPNAPTAMELSADEAIAKRIAVRAVQSLADSLPDEDTIEAQDRLKGTPQENLFVVSGEVLETLITVTISNAVYDGELGSPAALLAARREVERAVDARSRAEGECLKLEQEVRDLRTALNAALAAMQEGT